MDVQIFQIIALLMAAAVFLGASRLTRRSRGRARLSRDQVADIFVAVALFFVLFAVVAILRAPAVDMISGHVAWEVLGIGGGLIGAFVVAQIVLAYIEESRFRRPLEEWDRQHTPPEDGDTNANT